MKFLLLIILSLTAIVAAFVHPVPDPKKCLIPEGCPEKRLRSVRGRAVPIEVREPIPIAVAEPKPADKQ